MEHQTVRTPKAFFEAERDRFYDDWTMAFWRELFQNSTEKSVKATKVDIDLRSVPSRGSFADPAPFDRDITRVVFTDDGVGMSGEVLDKVYFSLGSTTKTDGGSVGGYGRARLMTCFANQRFSILTNDRFVMGDGPNFVNLGLDEAVAKLREAHAALVASGDGESNLVRHALIGLENDISLVEATLASGGFKGCRVEVDMDPVAAKRSYTRPTLEMMSDKLLRYLGESQIPIGVTINSRTPEEFYGVGEKIQAKKGKTRFRLSITEDGAEKEFASVHIAEGKDVSHTGEVLVRVDGASMFKKSVSLDVRVIVEIDREMSRDAMTSNRDSFRGSYGTAYDEFLQKLAIDKRTALASKEKRKRLVIPGEHGAMRAAPPARQVDLSSLESGSTELVLRAPVSATIESGQDLRRFGVPEEVLTAFMVKASEYASFIDNIPHHERTAVMTEVQRAASSFWGSHDDAVRKLREMSPEAISYLLGELKVRYDQSLRSFAEEAEKRLLLDGMHDTYVFDDESKGAVRNAMFRLHPKKWNTETGKGKRARSLLVAWSSAVSVAVETLMKVRPSVEAFDYSTGFVFSSPESKYEGDRIRSSQTLAAMTEEDGTAFFLLNPVTDRGELAYSPSDAKDRQRLVALAVHEVTHKLNDYHDEIFANAYTELMMEIDAREASRRMARSVAAVHAAYAEGRARVTAMDDDGDRPADRLLSAAWPGRDLSGVSTRVSDVEHVVDCDELENTPHASPEFGTTYG